MGGGSEAIEFSNGSSENNWVGTCEADHVDISPQENRRCSKSKMGEVEGGTEESGVVAARITCSE
jgi:hypothetical protein